MKFRILDLIFLTTLIALFIAVFQKDVTFFRQLLCFGLISVASTAAVLLFPGKWQPRTRGAIGGLVGGIVFLGIAYAFVFRMYDLEAFFISKQTIVGDPAYLKWFEELIPVLIFAVFFGSAIGPLLDLRIRKTVIPATYQRHVWFSIGLLLGMFLILLLSMLDRYVNFGDVREILPLLILALIVFVIHTNVWINRLEPGETLSSAAFPSEPDRAPSAAVEKNELSDRI